jgi:hypothetical protein
MLRYRLSIVAAGFLALICLATCVFWARRYKFRDEVNLRYWPGRVVELASMRGRVHLRNGSPVGSWPHRFSSLAIAELQSSSEYSTGFDAGSTDLPLTVNVPDWAVAVLSGCTAVILALLSGRTSPWQVSEGNGSKQLRLRFSLRMMLAVVIGFAMLIWIGIAAHSFTNEEPTIPLSDEVGRFNARKNATSDGVAEPPLTVGEVMTSIQSQLPNLNSNPSNRAVFEKIQKTGRLPVGSRLELVESASSRTGSVRQAWWIDLTVRASSGGYALRVRETALPGFVARSP